MPYIKQEERDIFDEALYRIYSNIKTPGQLNYCISYILTNMFRDFPSYTKANELIGAIECAKMEFYRKLVVPYEERKENENGSL